MGEERVRRKLAAILAADVVGYSRLVRADEEGTLATLKDLRTRIVEPRIAEHDGRVVKLMGDGVLAEFSSAVDAVRAAAEIQGALADQNAERPEAQRIAFRIGVNLGDVVIDGDDIQGDGVNVAARLEGLAEAGGMCVSGAVHDQVRDRVALAFDDLGEQAVKNIDRPVRVWRWRRIAPVAREAAASGAAPLPLPDKPSIAVLPFQNMSGDPEQEYFADGIAEDIITALSRFHWFFVIARNSSFSYKGTSPDIRKVAAELGVQYVLEGSVRKAGGRVRITAQLIDGGTGNHVWAERYDGELEDIFAVQDEITGAIAGAVAPSFVGAEAGRIRRKPPESLRAWDYAIHGNWHLWHLDRGHLGEARRLFEAAIALDPKNALALSGLALVCSWEVVWGWTEDPDTLRNAADGLARRAVAADEHDAWAHAVLSTVNLHRRRLDAAERAARRALQLNPNLAYGEFALASAYAWGGKYEAALEHVEKAERLSPRDPAHAWYVLQRAVAAFVVGRYEEQVELAERMTEAAPDHPAGWRLLTVGYGLLGRRTEAEAAARGLLRVIPHYTVELARTSLPGIRDDDLERLLDGLRAAGVPEQLPRTDKEP